MDAIKFAILVAYFQSKIYQANNDGCSELADYEIETLARYVKDCSTPPVTPSVSYPTVGEVRSLIEYMASDRKIEAIKMYRNLTGDGLVESKKAIESVINKFDAYRHEYHNA